MMGQVRNPRRKTVCCVSCGQDTRDYLCLCGDCRPYDDPVDDIPKGLRLRAAAVWKPEGCGISALHEWDEWMDRSEPGTLRSGERHYRILRLA